MEYVSVHGVDVPALGFGTWQLRGDACREAVADAHDAGYRHVDTAQMYENEAAVGRAIADADVDREEVFLVTKILRRNLAREDVHRSVEESLDRLDTYVDLLLIHAPSRTVPIEESIGAMNELQADGRVRHVGVSNFSASQLEAAMDASDTPILTNQVEYHPFRSQRDLLEFCLDEEVMLTAYSPVARTDVVGNETLREIGDRYGKTEAQVALRWLVQQPLVSAIPKAASAEHRAENLAIFDFELSDAEMERVFDLQGGLVSRLRSRLGL
jgi:diketogulonate reductase-like aldo/keto reductase